MARQAVNTTARVRVWIGDLEVSAGVTASSIQSPNPLEAALITATGSITLAQNALPFDVLDLNRTIFPMGSRVVVMVELPNGNLVRHPQGLLYVLGSEVSVEDRSIVLDVGCTLALLASDETQYRSQIRSLFALADPAVRRVVQLEAYDLAELSALLTASGLVMVQNPWGTIWTVPVFDSIHDPNQPIAMTCGDQRTALAFEVLPGSSTRLPTRVVVKSSIQVPKAEDVGSYPCCTPRETPDDDSGWSLDPGTGLVTNPDSDWVYNPDDDSWAYVPGDGDWSYDPVTGQWRYQSDWLWDPELGELVWAGAGDPPGDPPVTDGPPPDPTDGPPDLNTDPGPEDDSEDGESIEGEMGPGGTFKKTMWEIRTQVEAIPTGYVQTTFKGKAPPEEPRKEGLRFTGITIVGPNLGNYTETPGPAELVWAYHIKEPEILTEDQDITYRAEVVVEKTFDSMGLLTYEKKTTVDRVLTGMGGYWRTYLDLLDGERQFLVDCAQSLYSSVNDYLTQRDAIYNPPGDEEYQAQLAESQAKLDEANTLLARGAAIDEQIKLAEARRQEALANRAEQTDKLAANPGAPLGKVTSWTGKAAYWGNLADREASAIDQLGLQLANLNAAASVLRANANEILTSPPSDWYYANATAQQGIIEAEFYENRALDVYTIWAFKHSELLLRTGEVEMVETFYTYGEGGEERSRTVNTYRPELLQPDNIQALRTWGGFPATIPGHQREGLVLAQVETTDYDYSQGDVIETYRLVDLWNPLNNITTVSGSSSSVTLAPAPQQVYGQEPPAESLVGPDEDPLQ